MTDQTARDIVARAHYCREWGNFDDLHGELLAEVERLQTQVNTMIEQGVDEGLGLKSLTVKDGAANLSIATEGIAEATVLTMMDGLADILGDATNYVEFDLRRRGKEPVSVCVRRYARPSPHDLRQAAEAESAGLRSVLGRVRDVAEQALNGPQSPADSIATLNRILAVLDGDSDA